MSYNDASVDTNMRKAYLQNNAKCLDLAFSCQLNNERIKTNVWMEVIFGARFVTICKSKRHTHYGTAIRATNSHDLLGVLLN